MLFKFDANGKIIKCNVAYPPVELSQEEQKAVAIVLDILSNAGVDLKTINIERTKSYLKLSSGKFFLAFCHMKLDGRLNYIELTISSKISKELKDDPRFIGLSIGDKRFSRIPINDAVDIPQYADVIISSYEWGATVRQ